MVTTDKRAKGGFFLFIVAPISRVAEVTSVIEAGADEIYCGLLVNEQLDSYANVNCLNRRAEISSNLTNYEELKEVIRIARSKNIPVNLTLNEFYDQAQVFMALRQLEKSMECGIDRIIVADIGLLSEIKKRKYPNLKLHISSCASVFNSETVEFYKMFNPSRMILNRQLTLSEIEHLKRSFSKLEMEVFILNERCYNIDGFCTFLHGRFSPIYNNFTRLALNIMQNRIIEYIPRGILQVLHRHVVRNSLTCCSPYAAQYGLAGANIEAGSHKEKVVFSKPDSFLQACGICALYDFYKIGLKFFKISGRSLLANKTADIRLVKEAISILQKEQLVKEKFCIKIKELVQQKYSRTCSPEYCYY